MVICCTSKGGKNFQDRELDPVALPKEYLEEYQRCRKFLVENTETRGAENWEIQEGNHKTDPYILERAVYKFQMGKHGEKQVYRVRGRLRFTNATPQQIMTPIFKLENRPAWDNMMERGHIVAIYNFNGIEDCCKESEETRTPSEDAKKAGHIMENPTQNVETYYRIPDESISDTFSEATQHADYFKCPSNSFVHPVSPPVTTTAGYQIEYHQELHCGKQLKQKDDDIKDREQALIKDKDGISVARNDLLVRSSSNKSAASESDPLGINLSINLSSMRSDLAYLAYYGSPPVVSGRDLCILRFYGEYDGDLENTTYHELNKQGIHQTIIKPMMLLAKSVESPQVPRIDGYVRAELHECGYLFSPGITKEGEFYTDVTYISSLDMNGSFPKTFENVVLRQQPQTLFLLRKRLGLGNEDMHGGLGSDGPEAGLACTIM